MALGDVDVSPLSAARSVGAPAWPPGAGAVQKMPLGLAADGGLFPMIVPPSLIPIASAAVSPESTGSGCGVAVEPAQNAAWRGSNAPELREVPTIWPLALIASADDSTSPGRGCNVAGCAVGLDQNRPMLFALWVVYLPTICPEALIPNASLVVAP